jgi:tight adherence protein B
MLFGVVFFATFIASVVIMALALILTRGKQKDMEQRLRLLAHARAKAESTPPEQSAATGLLMARVRRLLLLDGDQPWEMQTTPARLALASLAAAVSIWLKSRYLFGLPASVAIVAAVLAAWFAPRFVLIRERQRMEKAFSALFPDAVDAIARMLRAGLPVTTAFLIVSREAPFPINAVFGALAGQLSIGMPVEDALRLSAQRIRIADFEFFAAAVVLQRSAGGNLLPTLESLGQLMRSRRSVQARAKAVTAEIRLTAYILSSLPFITVAALLVISPGYLTPLFADARGQAILALAVGGLVTSGLVMRQMMRRVEEA